jgi:hypothetical protein
VNPFDDPSVFFSLLGITALFFFLTWLAVKALAEAYRQVRFRCGRVRDDGPALDRDETRQLLAIRKGWRHWAPERVDRDEADR